MRDRMRLQPVQLVQRPLERNVRDEMVQLGIFLADGRAARLVDERGRARERVVRVADLRRVTQSFAAEVGWEAGREVLEGAELRPNVHGVAVGRCVWGVMVEDHGENGLGAACVLDGLGGEEEALLVGGGGVVGAVLRGGGLGGVVGAGDVFEEEDYAVDGT